jgi:hypothetical protein
LIGTPAVAVVNIVPLDAGALITNVDVVAGAFISMLPPRFDTNFTPINFLIR